MNAGLLGLFSGFPAHHFPDAIAQTLRENLPRRESLVFISAWPGDYARNDDDRDGMHGMAAEAVFVWVLFQEVKQINKR